LPDYLFLVTGRIDPEIFKRNALIKQHLNTALTACNPNGHCHHGFAAFIDFGHSGLGFLMN
jgi:hypothetical protein